MHLHGTSFAPGMVQNFAESAKLYLNKSCDMCDMKRGWFFLKPSTENVPYPRTSPPSVDVPWWLSELCEYQRCYQRNFICFFLRRKATFPKSLTMQIYTIKHVYPKQNHWTSAHIPLTLYKIACLNSILQLGLFILHSFLKTNNCRPACQGA